MGLFRRSLFWCVLIFPLLSYAQGNGGGTDPDVPVDGGVGFLLAAGAGYALKKLKDKNETHD
jgi:hypothetical protein